MNTETAIHIEPGIYKLKTAIPNPRNPNRKGICSWTGRDWWRAGEQFIVIKRKEQIEGQTAFEFFTISRLYSRIHQVRSYDVERWNAFVRHLEKADKYLPISRH